MESKFAASLAFALLSAATSTADASGQPTPGPCLCIFDIDRTLTGKQGDTAECPNNVVKRGVPDVAYGPGNLTLSEFAQHVDETFCAECYHGIISRGNGTGELERNVLLNALSIGPGKDVLQKASWQNVHHDCDKANSSFVIKCLDGQKQNAVQGIINWFGNNTSVHIADEDVYFFDDRADNIQPFTRTSYNARQISCGKRHHDGKIGLCGASIKEIGQTRGPRGVKLCNETQGTDERHQAAANAEGSVEISV